MSTRIGHASSFGGRMISRIGSGLLLGMVLIGGCQSADNQTPGAGDNAGASTQVGSVSMELTVGGDYQFGQVSYDISGNGFHKSGAIDVSGSTTLSTVISGIPFGNGYTLQLTAQDVDQKLTPCTGEATFDVSSATTVAVPVHLTCREIAAPPPPAPSVPVPAWATCLLGGLFLVVGARLTRRTGRRTIG